MISTRLFSELIISVQSAASDPTEFEHFLDQLSVVIFAPTAFMIFRNPKLGINNVFSQGGIHSAAERETLYANGQRLYSEHYGSQDPFHLALMRSGMRGAIPGERLIEPRIVHNTELYNALLKPHELEHLCLLPIGRHKNVHHQLCIWREKSPGAFTQDECEWLQLLEPHVRVTLSIQRDMKRHNLKLLRAEALLNSFSSAAFLLDWSQRLVYMNASAETMLQSGEVFRFSGGKLHAREAPNERSLCDAVSAMLEKVCGLSDPGTLITMSVSHPSSVTLQALVAPIIISAGEGLSSPHVLVLIKNEPHRSRFLPLLMRRALGCTEAECELHYFYSKIETLRKLLSFVE